jgi:diguanylate cyclase (GGDEF)-like protein/PAS domain S-box-containing protein
MQLQFHPYAIPLLISALASGAAAAVTWQKQRTRGASALAFSLGVFTFWSICYALVWLNVDRDAQLFWLKVMYLGVLLTPFSFFFLVLHITEHKHPITRPLIALLLAEPLVMLVIIWTNDSHHWFLRSSIHYTMEGYTYFHWTRGPAYWFNVVYSYALLLLSTILLVRSLFHGGPLFRSQAGAFLVGTSIPWLISVLNQFHFGPLRDLDLTPVAFAISGLVFYYAIFHLGIFDLLPVARSLLVEHMNDGLIVADASLRILDMNPAAEKLLYLNARDVIGKHGLEVFPEWRDLAVRLKDLTREFRGEVPSQRLEGVYFDISITPLRNRSASSGFLILFRDISERWNAEQKLRQTNQELRVRLDDIQRLQKKLRKQATRDPLTDLYNRRYLEDALEQELARAERQGYPVSIIMMDADKFKRINDLYGHKAGDRALQSLARLIKGSIRRSDIPCRYGGEEFVIVQPNTTLEVAFERAEQIRMDFLTQELFGPGTAGQASLSIGLAYYPAHGLRGEDVLDAADQAMYRAKSQGGNRTTIHQERIGKKVKQSKPKSK